MRELRVALVSKFDLFCFVLNLMFVTSVHLTLLTDSWLAGVSSFNISRTLWQHFICNDGDDAKIRNYQSEFIFFFSEEVYLNPGILLHKQESYISP